MSAKKLAELALLTGTALALHIMEIWIPNPVPIPGVKLGLANIVTVYALYRYKPSEAISVVTARVLLGALLSGNLFALLYSVSGSALCIAGTLLLKRVITPEYMWLAGICGAVLHNTGQTLAAALVMGGGIFGYYPFLIVAGCVTGAFTGFIAGQVAKRVPK